MKTYKETSDEVFERISRYERKKKKRRRRIAGSLAAAAVLVFLAPFAVMLVSEAGRNAFGDAANGAAPRPGGDDGECLPGEDWPDEDYGTDCESAESEESGFGDSEEINQSGGKNYETD